MSFQDVKEIVNKGAENMEQNYDFRKRLLQVHKKDIRNDSVWKAIDRCVVDNTWEIIYPSNIDRIITYAANDIRDYFAVSQGITLQIRQTLDIAGEYKNVAKKLILTTACLSPEFSSEYKELPAYRIFITEGIIICGNTARGTAQGCYYVEDTMSLNQGPAIDRGVVSRRPLFSLRMIHSGYGLDEYPDEHLKAIAHAGMDTILIFTKDVNCTPHGYLDFNNLIDRAAGFGIDVYAYSYYVSKKHPDDPDAREHYESTYGKLFTSCPGLKGVVFVGESMEFPSKDPNTTGRPYYESTPENNPEEKPSPGWYPCYDYPQWLNMVKDVIRSKNKDADIVFWTYNWGYAKESARLKLIESLPHDISLQATFEMFEEFQITSEVTTRCVDYTLSFPGPGKYFESEARAAHERGIRLYTMCNTGGLTWDIGVIPYEPAPYQWQLRYDSLLRARSNWGLCGLMESHHYGFWPSFVSELAKNAFWEPSIDSETMMRKIAARDFGEHNIDQILKVWQSYSDGIRKYVPTNEDQYGPFRIGPAYPLLFLKEAILKSPPQALFGNNKICKTMYYYDMSNYAKLEYEIKCLGEMRDCYNKGNKLLESILKTAAGRILDEAKLLLNLGRFIENSTITTINVKQWYILKSKLLTNKYGQLISTAGNPQKSKAIKNQKQLTVSEVSNVVYEMKKIAENEIKNAQNTIPLVEFDSRLGYEPSMEYMCDREHLEWKVEMTQRAVTELEELINTYRLI